MTAAPFDPARESLPALLDACRSRLSRRQRAAVTDDLIRRLRDCEEPADEIGIRDGIVVANRGVAEAIATRYRRRGIAHEDLTQVAYEALVKAVRRFDPRREIDLLSYAVPVIRGEVRRHFRDHGWTVRPPRPVQELQGRIHQTIEELASELGHEPSQAQVQEALGVDDQEYRDALAAFGSFHPVSLDQPVEHDSTMSLGDTLPVEDAGQASCEARLVVSRALGTLPPRERRMIYLRFFEEQTQTQIADQLGMSQMQVSRHLHRVLLRLRDVVGDLDTSGGDRAAPRVA